MYPNFTVIPFHKFKCETTEQELETKKIIYLTNKIPFLDAYGDININLVGHVIKSHKVRSALWKI